MNFQRPYRLALVAVFSLTTSALAAQAPSHLGPVTAVTVGGFTLTDSKTNTPVSVTVSGATKVLVVAPGSTDLKSATPGSLADVVVGDKALVTGTAGDTGNTVTAVRVILMKASAIATQSQQGGRKPANRRRVSGGIVKSIDACGKPATRRHLQRHEVHHRFYYAAYHRPPLLWRFRPL